MGTFIFMKMFGKIVITGTCLRAIAIIIDNRIYIRVSYNEHV